MSSSTIVKAEAEHFEALATDWWDPTGRSAMLHKLNPVRLKYVRDQIDQHWQCNECSFRPLDGRTALDVGCGAGLLAEPLARLGAKVTGIDASSAVINVAREHSAAMGLSLEYRTGDVQDLEGKFDLVTAMEVIEHVAEPWTFLRALGSRLADGGLLILSTPNATAWSKLLMVTIAERVGQIPRGTHDHDKFLRPEEIKAMLASCGLRFLDLEGIAWSPTRGLHLSDDVRLNYLICATNA